MASQLGLIIAGINDAEEIASLVNAAYRPQRGAAGWTHEAGLVEGRRIDTHQVRLMIAAQNTVILIHSAGHQIKACIHLLKDDEVCHLSLFAVHPSMQGQGLGKQVLAAAESFAEMFFRSTRCVLDVVTARESLVAFYVRRGYSRSGPIYPYPVDAGAGTPRLADLQVAMLEKPIASYREKNADKRSCCTI